MRLELVTEDKNTEGTAATPEAIEAYVQDFFNKAFDMKRNIQALYKQAQQLKAERHKQKYGDSIEPGLFRVHRIEAPAWKHATLEYQDYLSELNQSHITPDHQTAVQQHKESLQERGQQLKHRQDDIQKRLEEISQSLSMADEQIDGAAMALARGDTDTAQQTEKQRTDARATLHNEQQTLQDRLQVLEQALALLNVDIAIYADMEQAISHGLSMREYEVKFKSFETALAELEMVYLDCVELEQRLGVQRNTRERLTELAQRKVDNHTKSQSAYRITMPKMLHDAEREPLEQIRKFQASKAGANGG